MLRELLPMSACCRSARATHYLGVFIFLVAGAAAAQGPRVIVVQSSDLGAYRTVAAGFTAEVDADVQVATLPDGAEQAQVLWRKISELNPVLVFALGPRAATGAKRALGSVPVVFGMVPYYERYGLEGANVTGVALIPEVGASLDALKALSPRVKRVGMLHDPRYAARAVTDAIAGARSRGLVIVPLEASSTSLAERALQGARGQVDALLMVADKTVSNAAVVKRLLAFADSEHLPLLALSATQVKEGATLSLAPSYLGVGQQAGRLAHRIIYDRVDPSAVAVTAPETLDLTVNLPAARRLGNPSGVALELMKFAAHQGYTLKVYE